ncbi:Breast cancer type 2 susceptibility [Globisporangium polare]
MVLCIAAVVPFPNDQEEQVDLTLPEYWNLGLVLTDGWYSVYGVADLALSRAMWKVHKTQGLVGSKLVVWNAQLQNSTDGVDPLECAVTVDPWKHPLLEKEELSRWPYLKLQFNSTRRADFATPLGLEQVTFGPREGSSTTGSKKVSDERSSLGFQLLKSVPMRTLEVGSGMVRAVRILIVRMSPVMHLQSKDSTIGPRILCEEHMQLHYDVRAELARLRKRGTEQGNNEEEDNDQALSAYGYEDQQGLDTPLPTPFVKFDVLCTHELLAIEERRKPKCFGVLTMWRPSQDLLAGQLLEGHEYFASNLTVNWKIDGGASQCVFLRLSTTKGSRFESVVSNSIEEYEGESRVDRLSQLTGAAYPRSCITIGAAIDQLKASIENGSATSERKMVVDVCVYVLQASGGTTSLDDTVKDSAKPSGGPASSEQSSVKAEQKTFIEHAFATDSSARLMSIRVTGTTVSISSTANAISNNKRSRSTQASSSSSFVFRRGNRNVWKEGSIVCISGLEISHYDEQLGVLDCNLAESSQLTTHPSKKSHFYEAFQEIKGHFAKKSSSGGGVGDAGIFQSEVTKLKKYVDRHILQMDFEPTQVGDQDEDDETEAERLTQDFTAHELCFDGDAPHKSKPAIGPKFVAWDGVIIKMMDMPKGTSVGFPQEIIALAFLELDHSSVQDNGASSSKSEGRQQQILQTIYFTRALTVAFLELLRFSLSEDSQSPTHADKPHEQLSDGALVASVLSFLEKLNDEEEKENSDASPSPLRKFHVEARRETNERLLNSCVDWERLHALYLTVEKISLSDKDPDAS